MTRPSLTELEALCDRANPPSPIEDLDRWLDAMSPDLILDLIACVRAADAMVRLFDSHCTADDRAKAAYFDARAKIGE